MYLNYQQASAKHNASIKALVYNAYLTAPQPCIRFSLSALSDEVITFERMLSTKLGACYILIVTLVKFKHRNT